MTVGIFWCQNARSTYISVVCGGFLHLSTARFLSSLAARSLHLGFQNGRRPIGHFTVVCSVTWPLYGSEAGGDLTLIQTSLLYHVNAN